MSYARTLSFALLLAAPVLAQEGEPKKHLLRFNFKADHAWSTVVEQKMKMSMNMGGQDMNTTMDMKMFMSHKILGVEGNKADIEQEITRVLVKMDNPMMAVDYDSSNPESDPGMAGPVADMVGSKSKLTLTDTGKLEDVELDESLEESAGQGVDMKSMMKQSSVELPEGPVAIGETWVVEQKMPLGQLGETVTKVTNKLVSIDDDFFVIEQDVKVDVSEMEMPGGMTVDDVKMKGTNKVNRKTGMTEEVNMSTKMKFTGQMDMTMDMTMVIKPAPKQTQKPAEAPTTGGGK